MLNDIDILLNLSLYLFIIGVVGVAIGRKNLINVVCSIELIFLAAMINFVNFSYFLKEINGYAMSLFLLVVIAVNIIAVLSVTMVYFRKHDTIKIKEIDSLRG